MKDEKADCLTGECPVPVEREMNTIKLSEGSGGREMQKLIDSFREHFPSSEKWSHTEDDAASYALSNGEQLVFTTDAYVVTPIFFPGGNIGKIAFCGTVNDLSVMGATPIGLSLSFVLEEGLAKEEFEKIVETIGALSKETGIPIVTGDTKVVERGSVDKLIITTSGIGLSKHIFEKTIVPGDHIIVSGGIGEHGAALLAKRFELETALETDSKPLHEELAAIAPWVKQCKDITRGGLAAIANELAEKNSIGMEIDEMKLPLEEEVRALTEILGIDVYSLACEGRFVAIVAPEHGDEVLSSLKKFHEKAASIGTIVEGSGVIVQTEYGKKILSTPSGNIVPRIC